MSRKITISQQQLAENMASAIAKKPRADTAKKDRTRAAERQSRAALLRAELDARRAADSINSYWLARGKNANARIVREVVFTPNTPDGMINFRVESDIKLLGAEQDARHMAKRH